MSEPSNPWAEHARRMDEKMGHPRCAAIPAQGPEGSRAERWQCWFRAGHEGRHMAQRATGLLYWNEDRSSADSASQVNPPVKGN